MTTEYNISNMVLNEFLSSFKQCPFCQNDLIFRINASSRGNDYKGLSASLEIIHNSRMNINIRSDYFIRSGVDSFTFAISISDGQILCCDTTSQFVSIYDLKLKITKRCNQCPYPNEFEQQIILFYDRSESIFIAKKTFDYLAITDQDTTYTLHSSYHSNYDKDTNFSTILVMPTIDFMSNNVKEWNAMPLISLPLISFHNLPLHNTPKIIDFLQSISILS